MILRGSYGVWIIGCVACLTAFMSVFFSSRKTVFKKLARHLLDTWLSIELPSFFFYCNLDTFSTLCGLIEKVLVSSIAFRWQLGRSTELLFLISWIVPRHMHLSIAICSTPTSIDISTPSSVEIYWWPIYSPRAIHSSFLSISLSIPLSFHLPNLSLSLQTSSLGILKLFQVFIHLVSF